MAYCQPLRRLRQPRRTPSHVRHLPRQLAALAEPDDLEPAGRRPQMRCDRAARWHYRRDLDARSPMTIATATVCDAIHANVSHLPKGDGRRVHHRPRPRPVDRRRLEGAPRRGPHLPGPRAPATPPPTCSTSSRAPPPSASPRPGPRPPPRTSPPGNGPASGTPPSTCRLSMVTPVVNALIAGGIHSGVVPVGGELEPDRGRGHRARRPRGRPVPDHRRPVRQPRHLRRVRVLQGLADRRRRAAARPGKWHGEYVTAGQLPLAGVAAKLGVPPSSAAPHDRRPLPARSATRSPPTSTPYTPGPSPRRTPLPAGIKLWVD